MEKQTIEKIIEEFEDKFTRWEIMGSTLNDGSKMRFNRTPQEAIGFLKTTLHSYTKQEREDLLKTYENCPQCTGLRDEEKKRIKSNIGFLRQWLNEDRITDVNKLVTNEDLEHWIFYNLTPPNKLIN